MMFTKMIYIEQFKVIHSKRLETFMGLVQVTESNFKDLPLSYIFTYIDQDGDEILVENDMQLDNFLSDQHQFARIYVKKSTQSKINEDVIHLVRQRKDKQSAARKRDIKEKPQAERMEKVAKQPNIVEDSKPMNQEKPKKEPERMSQNIITLSQILQISLKQAEAAFLKNPDLTLEQIINNFYL